MSEQIAQETAKLPMPPRTEPAPAVVDSLKEELAKELQAIRTRNKTAKEQRYLNEVEIEFCRSFINLCYKISEIGVSRKQLKQLLEKDERYILEIDKFLSKKVWFSAKAHAFFFYAIPIINIMIFLGTHSSGDRPTSSWSYLCSYNILKKAYGEDHFPMESLKRIL